MDEAEKISEQLSAYLDGQLSDAESERLARRIEEDPELAGQLAQLRATRELIRRLPAECAPKGFAARVLAQAERAHLVGAPEADKSSRQFGWVRWAATAAVLLITMAAGVFIVAVLHWGETFEERMADSGDAEAAGAKTQQIAYYDDAAEVPLEPPSAGGEAACLDSVELADARNEIIYTDDMAAARRDVERVLISNRITPLSAEAAQRDARQELRRKVHSQSNVFQTNIETPGQVQYVAFATLEQARQIQSDLAGVRAGQRVTQAAGPMMKRLDGTGVLFGKPASTPARTEEARGVQMGLSVAAGQDRSEVEKLSSTAPATRPAPAQLAPLLITLNYRSVEVDASPRSGPIEAATQPEKKTAAETSPAAE